jgi:hypothetical protein
MRRSALKTSLICPSLAPFGGSKGSSMPVSSFTISAYCVTCTPGNFESSSSMKQGDSTWITGRISKRWTSKKVLDVITGSPSASTTMFPSPSRS